MNKRKSKSKIVNSRSDCLYSFIVLFSGSLFQTFSALCNKSAVQEPNPKQWRLKQILVPCSKSWDWKLSLFSSVTSTLFLMGSACTWLPNHPNSGKLSTYAKGGHNFIGSRLLRRIWWAPGNSPVSLYCM